MNQSGAYGLDSNPSSRLGSPTGVARAPSECSAPFDLVSQQNTTFEKNQEHT